MKKILALMLAGVILFSACAGKTPDPVGRAKLIPDMLSNTKVNQYKDLELTAEILERKAILPGMTFNVHITVTNKGDKTIAYVRGSGSSVVPDALWLTSNTIQSVLPEEKLGPMTMDFRIDMLAPGQSSKYVLSMMAVTPTEDFDTTSMKFKAETGSYIGTSDFTQVNEMLPSPELKAVKAGKYKAEVYFFYTEVEDQNDLSAAGEPTGYALKELDVTING